MSNGDASPTGAAGAGPAAPVTWLVGDIGGTNARFGLVSPDHKILQWRSYAVENYPKIGDALAEYLGSRGDLPMPRQAAIAIASPITGDRVSMTNHPWSFSIAALKAQCGFDRLEVINDFTALALALPYLGPDDRIMIGDGGPAPGRRWRCWVRGRGSAYPGWLPAAGDGWR